MLPLRSMPTSKITAKLVKRRTRELRRCAVSLRLMPMTSTQHTTYWDTKWRHQAFYFLSSIWKKPSANESVDLIGLLHRTSRYLKSEWAPWSLIDVILSSMTRTNSELRFDAAMQKLMTCSSIIVTKQFITTDRIENGGFLKNRGLITTAVVRADRVIAELISLGLLIKCDLVQGTRCGSYYRQFPSAIAQDASLSTALQVRSMIFILSPGNVITGNTALFVLENRYRLRSIRFQFQACYISQRAETEWQRDPSPGRWWAVDFILPYVSFRWESQAIDRKPSQ